MNGAVAITGAIANAIKASGVIIQVEPEVFKTVVSRAEAPLVVHAKGGILKAHHKYLTSYKGLAFYTKAAEALFFSTKPEIVEAKKIWIPEV